MFESTTCTSSNHPSMQSYFRCSQSTRGWASKESDAGTGIVLVRMNIGARYLTWKNFRNQIALYIGAIRYSSMFRLQGPGHLVVADLVAFLNGCLEANRRFHYPLLKSQMDQKKLLGRGMPQPLLIPDRNTTLVVQPSVVKHREGSEMHMEEQNVTVQMPFCMESTESLCPPARSCGEPLEGSWIEDGFNHSWCP